MVNKEVFSMCKLIGESWNEEKCCHEKKYWCPSSKEAEAMVAKYINIIQGGFIASTLIHDANYFVIVAPDKKTADLIVATLKI